MPLDNQIYEAGLNYLALALLLLLLLREPLAPMHARYLLVFLHFKHRHHPITQRTVLYVTHITVRGFDLTWYCNSCPGGGH